MKKNQQKKSTYSNWLFPILLSCFLAPVILKAQPCDLIPAPVGTYNSRVVATIEEDGKKVTVSVFVIGQILANTFKFGIYYSNTNLELMDSTFTVAIPVQESLPDVSANISRAIVINPVWADKGFVAPLAIQEHREAGTAIGISSNQILSSVADKRMFMAVIENLTLTRALLLSAAPGEAIPVFKFYLRKTTDALLSNNDFGFASKIVGTTASYFTPYWSYESMAEEAVVAYMNMPGDNYYERPELFSFRSPSSVTTTTVTDVTETTAVLSGIFTRGAENLYATTSMLAGRTSAGIEIHNGQLQWDEITHYGYIYTTSTVTITIDGEFSNQLRIDGNLEDFPSPTEVAAGYFVRNGNTFHIKWKSNSENTNRVISDSDIEVGGLIPNTIYNVWAIMQYKFETSNQFYAVNIMTSFTTPKENDVHKELPINKVNIDDYKLTVYPNPAICNNKATLLLELPNNEIPDAIAYIYDMNGKIVRTYHLTNYSTEIIVDFVSGFYIVKVDSKNGKTFVEKIIIQK